MREQQMEKLEIYFCEVTLLKLMADYISVNI
jgi:hypothetical protein